MNKSPIICFGRRWLRSGRQTLARFISIFWIDPNYTCLSPPTVICQRCYSRLMLCRLLRCYFVIVVPDAAPLPVTLPEYLSSHPSLRRIRDDRRDWQGLSGSHFHSVRPISPLVKILATNGDNVWKIELAGS